MLRWVCLMSDGVAECGEDPDTESAGTARRLRFAQYLSPAGCVSLKGSQTMEDDKEETASTMRKDSSDDGGVSRWWIRRNSTSSGPQVERLSREEAHAFRSCALSESGGLKKTAD